MLGVLHDNAFGGAKHAIRLGAARRESQGLTLERIYVDLGRGTFAHGQAYVALSRCRSLRGLALARPLQPRDVLFDSSTLQYRNFFCNIAV